MAKKGFVLDNIPNVVSSSSATGKNGWSLCIGAGVSMPIFPDWYTLAAELANEFSTDKTVKREDMQKLEFSPDALIQMVKNTTSISDHDFSIKMSQILYENLKTKIDPDEWNSIIEVLEANHLSSCTAETWEVFKKYRETLFASTTSYGLAKVILKSIDNNIAPKSILSFNAEPLLFALLNSYLMDYRVDETHSVPKQVFNKVTSSLSNQGDNRIPYIFCHGLLPVKEDTNIFSCSIDKLVFLEEEYLQLANTSFSWQANAFLNTCLSQHVIFIGTSLTDQNMRRWLSWIHSNRITEMKQHNLNVENSTQHYWIRQIPEDPQQIPWIEAAVAHLGIRLIWLKNWSEASIALEKLLGLYVAPKPKKAKTIKPLHKKPVTTKRSRYKKS
ncbi:MAG: SIR2 family protein [Clostridia bacterium]|nr:SIR2 family protein [Clostridia bacterium]